MTTFRNLRFALMRIRGGMKFRHRWCLQCWWCEIYQAAWWFIRWQRAKP